MAAIVIEGKVVNTKLFRVGMWTLLWVAVWAGLVDYLPQHPHIKYVGLLSPFILLTALINPSDLMTGSFPSEVVPGILYWLVFFVLLYFPRRKNRTKAPPVPGVAYKDRS